MAVNEQLSVRYAQIDPDYAAVLAGTPPEDDGPVWMVNLMKYKARAEYVDGRQSALTGQQADDEYAPLAEIAAVGAAVVLFADVEDQLLGDDPAWDRVAVVEYPTRRAFIDMQNMESFQRTHEHKDAGMERTIVIGAQPMPTPDLPGHVGWAEVPHPPTTEDGPVTVLHVLRFHPGAAEGDMADYQAAAAAVAVPHGLRIAGWFRAEGTILGDGRSWDQVRFNTFPSKAAFMAVALDPARLAAQRDHREPAIADTYSMILRPTIDGLRDSLPD